MMKGWTVSPRACRLSCLLTSSWCAGMKSAGGSRTNWRRCCRRSIKTAHALTQRERKSCEESEHVQYTESMLLNSGVWTFGSLLTESLKATGGTFKNNHRGKKQTYYLPSFVHPALVIYSAPGNRLVKGNGNTFSWVLIIWGTNTNTKLNFEHFSEELTGKHLSFVALNKHSLCQDCLSWFLLFWE